MGSCCHWSAALCPHHAVICREPITLLCFGEALGCAGAFFPAAPLRSLCSVCPQAGCESRAGSAVGTLAVRALEREAGWLQGCTNAVGFECSLEAGRVQFCSFRRQTQLRGGTGICAGAPGWLVPPRPGCAATVNSCWEAKSPSSPECAGFKLSFYLFRKC